MTQNVVLQTQSVIFLFHLPSQVCPNSIAARDGRIREGDRILQVEDGGLLNTNSHPTSVSQHERPFVFHGRALRKKKKVGGHAPSVNIRGGEMPPWLI